MVTTRRRRQRPHGMKYALSKGKLIAVASDGKKKRKATVKREEYVTIQVGGGGGGGRSIYIVAKE